MKLFFKVFLFVFLPVVASAATYNITYTIQYPAGMTLSSNGKSSGGTPVSIDGTHALAGAGPGSGYVTVTMNVGTVPPVWYWLFQGGCTPVSQTSSDSSSSGQIFAVVLPDTTCGHAVQTNYVPPCSKTVYYRAVNQSILYQLYTVKNVSTGTSADGSTATVAPGAAYSFSQTVDCSQVANYQIYVSGQLSTDSADISTGNFGSTNSASLPADYRPPSPSSSAPQASNILWSASSATNAAQAVKDSGSVLYDAIGQASYQAHNDANAIKDAVAASSSNVSLSNNVSVNLTNNLSFTNYSTEATLRALTNMIGDASGIGDTNFAGAFDTNFNIGDLTNAFAGYHYELTGPTNYDQAVAEARNEQLDALDASSSSWIAGFLNFGDSVDDYYGAVDMTYNMSYGIGSQMMDFDPLHNASLAQLFEAARTLIAWAIVALYLQKITTDGFKVILILNTAHGVNPQAVTAELKKS